MNLSRAAAAPKPIKIGDREFRLSPLRLRDWGEFLNWARDEYIGLRMRGAAQLNSDERRSVLASAASEAENFSPFSPQVLRLILRPDGAFRVFFLGLRREHPDLSADELETLIVQSDFSLTQIAEAVADVNGDGSDPKPEAAAT